MVYYRYLHCASAVTHSTDFACEANCNKHFEMLSVCSDFNTNLTKADILEINSCFEMSNVSIRLQSSLPRYAQT